MAREDLIMTLAKVVIAAAWADGDINQDEINSLKDLLFQVPELNAQQWAELDIYIASPVDEAERTRLLDELRRQIYRERDKELALTALENMITADSSISDEERLAFDEIKLVISTAATGLLGMLGRLIHGPMSRRVEHTAQYTPNRENYLDDFVRNRVFYGVRRRMDMGETEELDIPEDKLRKLSLAGGLMAQVAHVDREVTDDEIAAIVESLENHWDIKKHEAMVVAEIAVADISPDMDHFRLAREFVECCSRKELREFVAVLFEVAAADGDLKDDETEKIRTIARSLKLEHEDFIAGKLSVTRRGEE